MIRWTILCGCAIALFVVAAFTVRQASSVETQLSATVAEQLDAERIGASSIDANGRDVVVRGIASGERGRVRDLVSSLDGVRSVEIDDGSTEDRDPPAAERGDAVGPDAVTTLPTFLEQRRDPGAATTAIVSIDPATARPLVVADITNETVYLRGAVGSRADLGVLADLALTKSTAVRVLVTPGRPDPSPELVALFADIVRSAEGGLETGQVRLFGTAIEVRGRALPTVDPSDLRFTIGFIAAGRVGVVVDVESAS